MDVLISGAGVAGLTTAYWLRQYGFNQTIVERADALVVGGYKIDVRGGPPLRYFSGPGFTRTSGGLRRMRDLNPRGVAPNSLSKRAP